MKRNQIIQRWLQGMEGPDSPLAKKDGQYVVKL